MSDQDNIDFNNEIRADKRRESNRKLSKLGPANDAAIREENDKLRQQLQQADARVAELESVILKATMSEQCADAWLLRKQAEAVEAAVEYASSQIDQMGYQGIDSEMALKAVLECPKSLRQQADELEK